MSPDTRPRLLYREGAPEDVEGAAALAAATYGGDHRTWVERLGRTADSALDHLVLAIADDEVVGYGRAGFRAPVSPEDPAPDGFYLTGLVVRADLRGLGIGTRLTEERLSWVWRRDDHCYYFANARNVASIALHVPFGFTEIGRAASYLGEGFTGGSGVLFRAERPTPTSA